MRKPGWGEIQQIVNRAMKLESIPKPKAHWQTIGKFALTYDGYEACGSFDKCAEIANARRGDTLTELRTCLFFEQRRWRHFDAKPDRKAMVYIRKVIEGIRLKVTASEFD